MLRPFSKTFSELSPGELYAILRVRAEVFVVGQRCFYLDPYYAHLGWRETGPDFDEAGIPHVPMENTT